MSIPIDVYKRQGQEQLHRGVDIAVPTGTTVYAAMDGTVTTATYDRDVYKRQVAPPVAIPLPSRLPGKIPYFWAFLLYNNQNNRKIKEKYK